MNHSPESPEVVAALQSLRQIRQTAAAGPSAAPPTAETDDDEAARPAPRAPAAPPLPANSVEMRVMGQRFVLKARDIDPEFARQVAELVARKVKDAENRARAGTVHQILLVALMEIAEEYMQAKRRTSELQGEIARKSAPLLDWVEKHAPTASP